MEHVQLVSQRRQANAPQGHAGGSVVLRGVRGVQLFRQGAAGKYLRSRQGRQTGPYRRDTVSRQIKPFGALHQWNPPATAGIVRAGLNLAPLAET
jgi:hypothetical protein